MWDDIDLAGAATAEDCLYLNVWTPAAPETSAAPAGDGLDSDGIQLGLARDRARRENESALADLRRRFESLSPREREIMIEVARGRLSKQIASDIGIAEATVGGNALLKVPVPRAFALHRSDQSIEHRCTSALYLTSAELFACNRLSFWDVSGSMNLGAQEMHQTSVHRHL